MKKPVKLIFAGTSEFGVQVLEGIYKSSLCEVCAVFTQPDRKSGRGLKKQFSPVKKRALEYKLDIYQPVSLKSKDVQKIIENYNPDLIIVVAYGLLIPKEVLNIPKFGCLNVHASLLPFWRGAAPIQRALLNGDKKTGITIMKMDEGLDTGPILAQKEYYISKKETSGDLHENLSKIGRDLLLSILEGYMNGNLRITLQGNEKATYAHKISKEEARIDWNKSALAIACLVRAFNSKPIAYSYLNNVRIRIWEVEVLDINGKSKEAGEILKVSKEGVDVSTKDKVLRIVKCQMPGKIPNNIRNLINSYSNLFEVGQQFS
jgi:methionyl-tRNA formyltransferase